MAPRKKKSKSFHFLHMGYEESIINLGHDHHSLWSLLSALNTQRKGMREALAKTILPRMGAKSIYSRRLVLGLTSHLQAWHRLELTC